MSDRLNLAFLGCGEIAVHTSSAAADSAHARIVHCMDLRKELADDIAARHDAKSTDQLDVVLADGNVQAVVISTPHFEHAPLSIAATRAGKHVLVEKPMACTLDQADAMISAAQDAGVKLAVLLPQRLSFGYAKAGDLVAAGAIGQVVAYKIHDLGDKPPSYWHGGFTGRVKDDWRMSLAASGGGFLIMNEIHNLDSFVSIVDPRPQRIYAEYGTFRTPVEVEDFLSLVLRLEGGAVVSLDGSSAAVGCEKLGDRVYGTKGQLAPDSQTCRVHPSEPWEDIPAGQWVELTAAADYPDPRMAYLDAFCRAVMDDSDSPVPGTEGRRSLEIVRGAYLSMQRGQVVAFSVKE